MSDVIERFRREYQDYHRITDERAAQQRALLAEFEASLEGRTLTAGLQSDLQAFAGVLMNRGLHVNTVRKKLNMLRPFYSWAYASGLITAEQYMGLRSVKNPRGATGVTTPQPYSRKELDAFWEALGARLPLLPEKAGKGSKAIGRWLTGKGQWRPVWRHAMRLQVEAMVRLALDGGLRRHEIFGLKMVDLHYDNEYIVVRGKSDPNTGHTKVREVPFTQDMRTAVWRWLEFRALMRPDHDSPWLSCWTPNYSNPMGEGRFNELLAKAVGPGWRWHRFRHTCGTEWLRAGAELETVSRLLGHATLQQTLGYSEIVKADIARAMSKSEAAFSEAVTNRAA